MFLDMRREVTTFWTVVTLHGLGPLASFDSELTSESMNPFRHLVGLLWWGISPSQGLYPHRTAQHKKTKTYINASSRIRTCDPKTTFWTVLYIYI